MASASGAADCPALTIMDDGTEGAGGQDIVISLVQPISGGKVELYNTTGADIDLSAKTYQLVSATQSVPLTAGVVKSHGYLSVDWTYGDQTGGGEIVLYHSATNNPANLDDFICWDTDGAGANSAKADAQSANKWNAAGTCVGALAGTAIARKNDVTGVNATDYDPASTRAPRNCGPITVTTQASGNITFGGSVTDTAILSGGVNPGGTITFSLFGPNDSNCGGTAVFTSTKTVSGNGSYISDAFTPAAPGTYRWIASYGGDTANAAASGSCNDANESVVVSEASTSTTVSSSLNPSTFGQNVTFTATVTPTSGSGPTGTVQFKDNGASMGSAQAIDSNGVATFSSSSLTPGSHTITADYSGDANFNASSGTLSDGQVVNAVPTPTPSPTPTATATATATPTATATATPVTSPTPTATATATATPTATATATPVTSPTPTATATATATPTATATATPVTSPTPTPTATATATATPTATATATPVTLPTPTATAIATATPSATATATATPAATPTATPTASPAQALNISTRMRVDTGSNVLIAGFIITGNANKNLVVRGLGPSLVAFGIADALVDPTLELHGSDGSVIVSNDNWQDNPSQAAQLSAVGLAPTDPKESGIFVTLQPGAYTAIVAGKNQGTGIGVEEVYDTTGAVDAQLANISTRGFVLSGNNVMIAGFILGGNANTNVVVRGIGPSLAQFDLSPVLADPTLELHDGNGTTLIANDNWTDDPISAAQLIANGLEPSDPKESGIFTSLPAGQFTAILAGKNGGTGIGVVEVYNLK